MMSLKKKDKKSVIVSNYTVDEALMIHEALEFTLRECSHLHTKNRLDHGSLLTEKELEALRKLSTFLAQEDLRYTAFILENGGNV